MFGSQKNLDLCQDNSYWIGESFSFSLYVQYMYMYSWLCTDKLWRNLMLTSRTKSVLTHFPLKPHMFLQVFSTPVKTKFFWCILVTLVKFMGLFSGIWLWTTQGNCCCCWNLIQRQFHYLSWECMCAIKKHPVFFLCENNFSVTSTTLFIKTSPAAHIVYVFIKIPVLFYRHNCHNMPSIIVSCFC